MIKLKENEKIDINGYIFINSGYYIHIREPTNIKIDIPMIDGYNVNIDNFSITTIKNNIYIWENKQ